MATEEDPWSPERLQEILKTDLKGREVIVLSNREPYIHDKVGERIVVKRPASGLVTALEPVMRACSGIWVAHGSGNADKEALKKGEKQENRFKVPPEDPSYWLRRVWLTSKEEWGYYYKFANSGLWPLCHPNVSERPTFHSNDYAYYEMVNKKFAEAVKAEATTPNPVVLVQDYHFTLVPQMLRFKKYLPQATIVTFWHIPWPSADTFGTCPWRKQLLEGLLGSDILGFHLPQYCENFLEAAGRYLDKKEADVDRKRSVVTYRNRETLRDGETAVRPYPISIAWPLTSSPMKPVPVCRSEIRERYGIAPSVHVGFGVDRLDYTKGILDRFSAIERLLEIRSGWKGDFTFIQIAAPSRSAIGKYKELEHDVRAAAENINEKYARDGWEPICLKVEHYEPEAVFEHYRGCDLLFVSSLQDGMNLVAKEFVAARDDEQGVLVLSEFAGAASELACGAILVNPFDTRSCAEMLHRALSMQPSEQLEKMRAMRKQVEEHNVYKWAGDMLLDAAQVQKK
jgi:trehalose 6-phosphate synthase